MAADNQAKMRVVIPVEHLIATKRRAVCQSRRLPNGDTELIHTTDKYWWSLYFDDGSTISFCTGDLAPPSYAPKVQLVIELEPADSRPPPVK